MLAPSRAIPRVLDAAARARWRQRDAQVLPAIVEELVAAGLAERTWQQRSIHRARWSPRGATVALVGPTDDRPRVAIKIAHDEASGAALERERLNERAVHADERLAGWAGLVPEPLAAGLAGGLRWAAETAAEGVPAVDVVRAAAPRGFLGDLASVIADLHERTAEPATVGEAHVDRWLRESLESVLSATANTGASRDDRTRLGKQLARGLGDQLVGRSVVVSRVHGDYWPGNLLVAPASGAVTAVLDWDRSDASGLPGSDLLHLVLFSRATATGVGPAQPARDVAAIIRGDPRWTSEEEAALGSAVGPGCPALPEPLLATLYWLGHIAATLRLMPGLGRDRGFVADQVDPVLAAAASVFRELNPRS